MNKQPKTTACLLPRRLHSAIRMFATSAMILFAVTVTDASHPKEFNDKFEGIVSEVTEKSITVQNRNASRVFRLLDKQFTIRNELGSGTCFNGLLIDLKPSDVFKRGDLVSVSYLPTMKSDKFLSATDIWFCDSTKASAWRKSHGR